MSESGCSISTLLLYQGESQNLVHTQMWCSTPGRGGRQALWVCLVAQRVGVSPQHCCVGAGSHPEGEPPVGSVDLFYLGEAPVVGAGAEPACCFPMGPPLLPCLLRLLLLLRRADSLLVPYSTWVIEGSGVNRLVVGGLPSLGPQGYIPGRRTPSRMRRPQRLASQWSRSSNRSAR